MSTPQSAILPEAGPQGLYLIVHLQQDVAADRAACNAATAVPGIADELNAANPDAALAATVAFGAGLWTRISADRPQHLADFAALGRRLGLPATNGDLLLHLHANRADLNFLAAKRFIEPLRPWIAASSETHGFRYLDSRDLTGFIDGTENPHEPDERRDVTLIGDEDADFTGGSYLLAQRFVHDLGAWEQLPQAEQEGAIGRTKPDSVELDEAHKPDTAHISRVVIEEHGEELEIVRHGMPYGSADGEAGLFFLGYCRDRTVFDKMLGRMFGASDDGLRDRLMAFTRPVSNAFFFAPSQERLAALARA